MLHHDQGIPQIPHLLEGGNQAVVISLMEADARLIQNIQNPHQFGTDLGRQANPLRFSSRQRPGRAGQTQITESHIDQKTSRLLISFNT